MSIDRQNDPREDEVLKFKQKLENSEIQVRDQVEESKAGEMSDLEVVMDVAYDAIDQLKAALQGKVNKEDAAEFGDAQMRNLVNSLDTVKSPEVRAQITGQIREISDLQAQLSEQSTKTDLAEVQAKIQQL